MNILGCNLPAEEVEPGKDVMVPPVFTNRRHKMFIVDHPDFSFEMHNAIIKIISEVSRTTDGYDGGMLSPITSRFSDGMIVNDVLITRVANMATELAIRNFKPHANMMSFTLFSFFDSKTTPFEVRIWYSGMLPTPNPIFVFPPEVVLNTKMRPLSYLVTVFASIEKWEPLR